MAIEFITGYVLGSRNASRAAGLASSAASFSVAGSSNRTEDLAERVDRLMLVVQAMWSMLEEDGRSQEDLVARIAEIDGLDGSEDGVAIAPPRLCPNCEAKVGASLRVCQFCGTDIGDADPFAR